MPESRRRARAGTGRVARALLAGAMLLAHAAGASTANQALPAADVEDCNRIAQTKLNPLSTGTSEPAPRRSRWPRAKSPAAPPSPAVTPDPADESLRGMQEVGYTNEHYRKAYRECMKGRGASENATRD
jgi:hypothetical protein